jgi:TonB family protein
VKIFEQHSDHVSLDNIRRYLNDQMSNEEMHVLERHLLDCEFCNEAFKGYELSNELSNQGSLDSLKNRLDNRVKVEQRPKLAIAAVVIFLLCFSIVLTFLVLDNPEVEVSMVEESSKEATEESMMQSDVQEQSEEVVEETNPEIELEADEIPIVEEKEKAVSSKKTKPQPQSTALPTTDLVEDEVIESDIDLFGASDAAPEDLEEVFAEEEITFDFAEDTEQIDLASNDNVLLERRLEAPPNQPLQTRSKALAAGRSSKLQGTSPRIALDDMILSSNAQPIGGVDRYKLYLRDSLRYPENARSENTEGEVKVVFQVNKNGDVENFKITKSLSFECDSEAKRLVLEGEKWSLIDNTLPEENNVVNLTIQFNLSD